MFPTRPSEFRLGWIDIHPLDLMSLPSFDWCILYNTSFMPEKKVVCIRDLQTLCPFNNVSSRLFFFMLTVRTRRCLNFRRWLNIPVVTVHHRIIDLRYEVGIQSTMIQYVSATVVPAILVMQLPLLRAILARVRFSQNLYGHRSIAYRSEATWSPCFFLWIQNLTRKNAARAYYPFILLQPIFFSRFSVFFSFNSLETSLLWDNITVHFILRSISLHSNY